MTIEGLTALRQNVIEGEADLVPQLVQAALDAGEPAEVILKQGLIAAMDEVGRQFEAGDFFVPEMLFAARAMQAGLVLLKPRLQQSEVKAAG
ncbi:MAG: B12-binding domain-containing protein, partial [Anaerolineales bacterium]|nr:B12-binding domain-containing protein [Anaerolineales bacterium]